MSRHSAFDQVTGAWGEIKWLSRPVPQHLGPDIRRYVVQVGERKVGEVWAMEPGWLAISGADKPHLRGLRGVSGFRTRWAATEYILDVGVRLELEDE
jgi:hypothetical protein